VIKKAILFQILAFMVCQLSFSQSSNKENIGIHVGYSETLESKSGIGFHQGASYNRDFSQNRFRLSPSVSVGSYEEYGIIDYDGFYNYSKVTFNSTSAKLNLYWNYINFKSSNFFIGTGLTLNRSRGFDALDRVFTKHNYGINGCLLGYRFFNPEKRFGF
jgi:hypothetical protein